MRFLGVCIAFLLPSFAHGAVTISEIAWMGSSVSPNDEWIELYNSGDAPVSLENWVLSDDAELSIGLSGSIGAHEYAVLERTDDSTVTGQAFLIYTGSLSNEGTTLYLRREDGSLEDQVAGGNAWENIGGDNTTKETAQKTDAGWRTAPATPGSGPSVFVSSTEEDEEKNESDPKGKQIVKTIELQLPSNTLDLTLHVPDIAYVNQPVVFDVEPSGLGKTLLDSLAYTWNFGDFTTSGSKKAAHVYAHPGEYVVTLHGTFARHEAVERTTITILPVTFSLSLNDKGDVLLRNNAKYEVNVSGYTLTGKEQLTFPPRSIVLPNSTITIERKRLGGSFAAVRLFDQGGELIAALGQNESAPVVIAAVNKMAIASTKQEDLTALQEQEVIPEATSSNFSFAQEVSKAEAAESKRMSSSSALALASIEQTVPFPKESLPLLGLFGIVTVGIMAVLAGKRR